MSLDEASQIVGESQEGKDDHAESEILTDADIPAHRQIDEKALQAQDYQRF